MRFIWPALLAGCVWSTAAAQTDVRPSLAVLALGAKAGVEQSAVDLVTSALVDALRRSGSFARVASTRELETAVGFERMRQLGNCETNGCAAEIAGALGVNFIISGEVGRLGSSYVITVSLMQANTAQTAASRTQRLRSDNAEALLDAVDPLVFELLTQAGLNPAPLAAPPEKAPAPSVVAPVPPAIPPAPAAPAAPAPAATPARNAVKGVLAGGATAFAVMFAGWAALSLFGFIPVIGWAAFILNPLTYALVGAIAGYLGIRSSRAAGNLDLPLYMLATTVATAALGGFFHVFTIGLAVGGGIAASVLWLLGAALLPPNLQQDRVRLFSVALGVAATGAVFTFLVDSFSILAGPVVFMAVALPLSSD